jgi:predicted O-methyltransferase YrrM
MLSETSMITPVEAKTIKNELDKLSKWGRLLELGTGFGHSAAYFSTIKPNWTIYTIDAYGRYGTGRNLYNQEQTFKQAGIDRAKEHIDSEGNGNVITIYGNTVDTHWELPLDALFIDADHSYDWVKKDTEHYIDFISPGGIIFYHDYNDNWDVQKYFDAEMINRPGWETWDRNGIAFAKKI